MHPTQLTSHARTVGLAILFSIVVAGTAAPQMGRPQASLAVVEETGFVAGLAEDASVASSTAYPRERYAADASLASLDPAARREFERMLSLARHAGFRVRVTEARRSVERQAYLLTLDGHLTHTATSRHADGLAVDVVADDGNLRDRTTRSHWIAFRRWLAANEGDTFRLLGEPDRSWDWPHLELVEGPAAFHSVEEALAAARWCAEVGIEDCTAGRAEERQ